MSMEKLIKDLRSIYQNDVKAPIEKKYYEYAGLQMGNFLFLIEESVKHIVEYHHGRALFADAKLLERSLSENKPSRNEIRNLEVSMAQFSLAVQSENKY